MQKIQWFLILVACVCSPTQARSADAITTFVARYCAQCHGESTPEAALDLTSLPRDFTDVNHGRRWTKVHDRIASGEMPPRDAPQPDDDERTAIIAALSQSLLEAERESAHLIPRLRRLTRTEYENSVRDLFDMPGIALAGNLPADGSTHGFDKHPEALDISHVNVAKYLEAADHILDYAIATRPVPPTVQRRRISLANRGGFVAHIIMNGDGLLLKDKQPDPDFPPAAEQNHLDQGAHEQWGSFRTGATVGVFRHEDESVSPYFAEHVTIYPARYRVRTSLWSFQWDQGKMLPARGTEAARLSVVQLTGDGRGGQHPSYALGYFDAPDTMSREHEVVVWLNHNEIIGFNAASLAPAANYYKKRRAMEFTGPGIAVDWLDIEGPLYESWPPQAHKLLLGDLPIVEFKSEQQPGIRPPARRRPRQIGAGMNRLDPEPGLWTVQSEDPLRDADQLLANFLPKLFRRPVADEVRRQYTEIVRERLEHGDCFELAMRAAYRNALVAPDFLYHVEPLGKPDDYALACRLSYFLWNTIPDETLLRYAATGELRLPRVLHAEIERLLADPRSQRFVHDFVGQWLKLKDIASTDPDSKLYPEFSPYLQDSMVAETRAYFQHLLDHDLDAAHLVKSPFVLINQKLATHYGITDVRGTAIRPVPLPDDCPRGGFLTQAAILKITANGTTTSPVPRGAFVLERLQGEPPEPPPANVAAIEPDVRGATTVREQLAKHREHDVCASCHRRIDPPGFALESFDVIGGFRDRYRSIGKGDAPPRGSIDPMIGISFRLGPSVDSSGELSDGRTFTGIRQYQDIIAADSTHLLQNLAQQFAVYAIGRAGRFSDRAAIQEVVQRTQNRSAEGQPPLRIGSQSQRGGIRTLIHELVSSRLFTGETHAIERPADLPQRKISENEGTEPRELTGATHAMDRMMMIPPLADITKPVIAQVEPAPAVKPTTEFTFNNEYSVQLQVQGLFIPERGDDFRKLLDEFPEARLMDFDYETAVATIAYASDSEWFRDAKPEQIIERLNNRMRQLSSQTLGVAAPSSIPRDKLQRVEFRIVGLDCKACSLGVYNILTRVEGVVQATASFHDGLAVAWIAPEKTNREALAATLKSRGVQLEMH